TAFLVFLAVIELCTAGGGGGGGDKKVIIHVPFKVKTVHHTHTVVKHVDHGGGDKEFYKVIGYSGGIDDGHEVEAHGGGGGGGGGGHDWGSFGGGFGGGHAESLESSSGQETGDIGSHTSGGGIEASAGYSEGFEGGHGGLEQAASAGGGDMGGGDYGGGYAVAQGEEFGSQGDEGYGGEQGGYQ
ncbi:glycine-rich protein DOT1-like, partial [Agrilus planipennis]